MGSSKEIAGIAVRRINMPKVYIDYYDGQYCVTPISESLVDKYKKSKQCVIEISDQMLDDYLNFLKQESQWRNCWKSLYNQWHDAREQEIINLIK